MNGHLLAVTSVTWSPDGTLLASGSEDKTVKVWDTQTGEASQLLIGHSRTVSCLAFKPNDPSILVTGCLDATLKLWDLSTSSCLSTVRGDKPISCLAFSTNSNTIAAGEGHVHGGRNYSILLYDVEACTKIDCPQLGHSRRVTSVAWNNDGTKFASGSWDYTVLIWEVGSGGTFECKSSLNRHTGYVSEISCSCVFSKM